MDVDIHPTAIVSNGAELGVGVRIGAYATIGPMVILGDGTEVAHHATVDGKTRMGKGNRVHPYAYIGGQTQDLKYAGGDPGLVIGEGNHFREFCTVHCATPADGETRIGSFNHFLAYTHVAHDCCVGNHVVMSNNGTLAGHVVVEDHVVVGGLTAVHQFCRIGYRSMLGGCSKVVQDVPPYTIAEGNPAKVRTINKVGLERAGMAKEEFAVVRYAFRVLYREGLNFGQAMEKLRHGDHCGSPVVQRVVAFIEGSERGLA